MPEIPENTPKNTESGGEIASETAAKSPEKQGKNSPETPKKCLILRQRYVESTIYACASVFTGTAEQVAALVAEGDGDDSPAAVAWGEENAR